MVKRSYEDNNDKIHCKTKRNFKIPKANKKHFGLKTIQRLGPIIWNFVPDAKNKDCITRYIQKAGKKT